MIAGYFIKASFTSTSFVKLLVNTCTGCVGLVCVCACVKQLVSKVFVHLYTASCDLFNGCLPGKSSQVQVECFASEQVDASADSWKLLRTVSRPSTF